MTPLERRSSHSPIDRLRSALVQIPVRALIFAFACLCLAGSRASAQELGAGGQLSFGAERLFGFYLDKQNTEINNVDVDTTTTVVGLGWSANNPFALLSIPRLGIDYFLDPHLTLGGSFGIASVSAENDDVLAILLAARVGYALRITNAISFWPRGGLTFASLGGDDDLNVFALTLEGNFTIAPSDGWAFMGGPIIDLGFTGGAGDADHSELLFGLMFGIVGWLEI